MGFKKIGSMARSIAKLQRLGPEACFLPRKVNGVTRSPLLGALTQAKLRRRAIIDGTYGTWDPETGRGWDASWDKPHTPTLYGGREFKGSKRSRTKRERVARIDKAMADMPKKIEEYKQSILDGKEKSIYQKYRDQEYIR